MKKILSLLNVLTISGSTMPSIIAANSYQKKEIDAEAYYDVNKKDEVIVHHDATSQGYIFYTFYTLDFGEINPLNYKKIEFLGDTDKDCWGSKVKWGDWIYTNTCDGNGKVNKWKGTNIKTKLEENNNYFHSFIINQKIDKGLVNILSNSKDEYTEKFYFKKHTQLILQNFEDWDGGAHIMIQQRFGLTFYWEKGKYYLQVITYQFLEWWASFANLEGWIKIGTGIRLYND